VPCYYTRLSNMSQNTVMRTTNIRFPSHSEMENCLASFDIPVMKEVSEKVLKDGEYVIDDCETERTNSNCLA
jgi:hypothetical protein